MTKKIKSLLFLLILRIVSVIANINKKIKALFLSWIMSSKNG
jgi:hypothetical protein